MRVFEDMGTGMRLRSDDWNLSCIRCLKPHPQYPNLCARPERTLSRGSGLLKKKKVSVEFVTC